MKELSPSLRAARLVPFLSVRRGREAVNFYKAAFGARELFRFDAEDESVVAQLEVGDSNFWVSDESPQFKNFSPESLGGGTMHLVIVVDNPDTVYEGAIAAGAAVECPVRDEPHGWRIGKLRDPFGHAWEIARLPK